MSPLDIATGLLTAGVVAGALVATQRRPRHPLVIAAAAAGPLALPLGGSTTLLAALTGNLPLAGIAAGATLLWRYQAAPEGARRTATTAGQALTLLSSNLLYLNRRPRAAAQAIARTPADVIVTVETAEAALEALGQELHEHRLSGLGSGPRGDMVALWVRHEIEHAATQIELPDGSTMPGILTRVDGQDTQIIGVHLYAPVSRRCRETWDRELEALRDWAATQPTEVILAGDFNAAVTHPGMRELVALLPDAARSLGRGMLRTWPARGFRHGRGRCLPIFGLDHILTSRGLATRTLETRLYPGADHLALLATISRSAEPRPLTRADHPRTKSGQR